MGFQKCMGILTLTNNTVSTYLLVSLPRGTVWVSWERRTLTDAESQLGIVELEKIFSLVTVT